MAVSNDRVLGWTIQEGSINSTMFATFITTLDFDGRDVAFLDNASIHKSGSVMNAFRNKQVTPLFLPPYTPQFQPIEHCFSVLKHRFRQLSLSSAVGDDPMSMPSTAVVKERIDRCIQSLTSACLKHIFIACWSRSQETEFSAIFGT